MRILLATIALFITVTQTAMANSGNYIVRDIQVSAVSSSATKAREEAMQKGQKQAFTIIVKRLAPKANLEELASFIPELAPEEEAKTIANMVQAIDVHHESVTNTGYKAMLDIRFQPEYVQSFLKQNDIAFSEKPGISMLVIPVFFDSNQTPHVDLTSDWSTAWKTAISSSKSDVKFVFPRPNDPALAAINPVHLLSESYSFRNDDQLQTLANRYGTRNILFAAGRYDSATPSSIVTAIRAFGGKDPLNFSESFSLAGAESPESLMANIATKFRSRIEGYHSLLGKDITNASHLEVMIPLYNLENWLQIKQRLSNLRFIRSWKVEELSSNNATIELAFASKPDNLSEAFAQAGFYLEQYEDRIVLNSAPQQSQPSFFNLLPRQ